MDVVARSADLEFAALVNASEQAASADARRAREGRTR